MLPGGNTFYDYVGQSPINVWQASEDYGTLHTVRTTHSRLPTSSQSMQQDFPFYIRIPESIPPSIALEKGGEFVTHQYVRNLGLLRQRQPEYGMSSLQQSV